MNNDTQNPQAALGVFYALMFLIGVGLLLLIPVATSPGPADQGWWTQPSFMPTLSLLLVALPATYLFFQYLLKLRKNQALRPTGQDIRAELLQWFKPVEYFVYYVLYIWLLGMVGYFLSSLIFIIGLSIRVGLRSRTWMLSGLLFAIALIAMFRWALGVWVPPAALYDLFPKDIRIFLMGNF